MTDRILQALARVHNVGSRLAARGLEDQEAAAWPASGDGPHVTSSGVSRPTENGIWSDDTGRVVSRLSKAGDHQLAVRLLEQAATLMERGEERMTPSATGEQCPTVARNSDTGEMVSCQRPVTHHGTGRGLCERCDRWFSRSQNRGFHPGVQWIIEGNRSQVRWCACGPDCCPRDKDDHGPCADRAEEGRTVSRRCRQRLQRSREAQKATG